MRDSVRISDISAEGCRLSADSLYFRIGMRLVIRPAGLEGLTGVVRWVLGDTAGVEFDTPIYGPVLDHLATLHSAGKPVSLARYR